MEDSFQPLPRQAPSAFDGAASTGERIAEKVADVRDDVVRIATDGAARVKDAGHRASGALHETAEYIREQDLAQMVDDVKAYTRSHPAQALLAAAALGFFAAALIRRT